MRLLFPVSIAVAIAASAPAQPGVVTAPSQHKSNMLQGSDCPNPSSHFARNGSVWRQVPLEPKRLTELPPADTYAAVYHLDERGCMVPVKYRDVRR
ncbi:MAG TPA: hypothetical protein VFT40_10865 [Sphingomicrobium sp.]|jgi:hypothetical protein|nr:hypothetical protein [Sphingomicrobium sp.]